MKELFNDGKIRVRTNGSGEIFIERLLPAGDGVTLRIGPIRESLSITADSHAFWPTSFNGLGGFIVK